jgi:hypothetical protein
MKTRSVVLSISAVVVVAGLCLARPGRSAAEAGTRQAASASPTGISVEEQIVAKEREELDCLKSGDTDHFAGLLAEDAIFVDAHGPADKDEVVKNSAEFRLLDYSMEDVRFVPLSARSGLIAYKITEQGNSHGKPFNAVVYVSALWTLRDGKWVCVFSQETAAK